MKCIASLFAFLLYAGLGGVLLIGPTLFLLYSSRSPFKSADVGWVKGFAAGAGFVFFAFLGITFVALAFKYCLPRLRCPAVS